MAALRDHQVVIVAGDTGSGKSTQLPQYCLELGRGTAGLIAHTQPRRVAARAMAARIAEELSQPVGGTIGFRVRFADRVSASTRLVLMTDGLLLAELSRDKLLRRYDTVIVDEAHERSLNVDLLLGVLKRVCAQRRELSVIVTSATLDVERMAAFFDGAPVIQVGGRSHPIETRYRDGADTEDPDLAAAVLEAYREISAEPGDIGGGDVLVFLPGEREIRDVGEVLERELHGDAEVLPLYSRLAWDQQSRIFQTGGRRRVVLATNVAETSITVPGVRAVIDSGLVRLSRYSPRHRLQRLPIEPVSQAGAEQRKGRCGRLGAGLCVRLYAEEDFASRLVYTEPEVLRTNLAALLLRLAADGLGAAEDFPFIDAPDPRALGDGYRLLQELEAFDPERRITRRGRAMARLPLDPRLARALLESKRFRAEAELFAIVSGLSVPDVRIAGRPASAPAAGSAEAAEGAAVIEDAKSEFSAMVKLWRAYGRMRAGPRRELRRWCRERQLSLLRLREWEDVHAQVVDRAADIGIVATARAASYSSVHRSLLAGFCTLVGTRGEAGAYVGTRGVEFHLLPGSALRRRRPAWVVAANIVETSRVFARPVAEVEPQWIEAAAAHLVKREFLAPDWDEEREEVVAHERVSLRGLTLRAARLVNYGPIAPEEARQIFAREALVHQRLRRRPDWLLANDAALLEARRAEERLRTRELLVGAESLVEFYTAALPRQVSSSATLEHFTRHLSRDQLAALSLGEGDIYARVPEPQRLAEFPETARVGGLALPVAYRFAPGEPGDGATLVVPLVALPLVTRADIDAAVPGLAKPRVEALLRSLPKEARRSLIPIADTAAQYLAVGGTAEPRRLAAWIQGKGLPVALIRFDLKAVPAHLILELVVMPGGQKARGSDLAALRRACAGAAAAELAGLAALRYPADWRRFEVDLLPEADTFELPQGPVRLYPALARSEANVSISLHWTAAEASRCMSQGAVALARLMLAAQERELRKRFDGEAKLLLGASPFMTGAALRDLLLNLAFSRACFADDEPPRVKAAFDAVVERGRASLHACLDDCIDGALGWFAEARELRQLLDHPRNRGGNGGDRSSDAAAESRAHLHRLLDPAVLGAAPPAWLRRLPLYLKAETRRWQRHSSRGQDAPGVLRELIEWSARVAALQDRVEAERRHLPELEALRWWVEEYRLSRYAQELKTLGPVSSVRLAERAATVEAWLER